MVEELVVNSGIPYTITQPAILMQNILEGWKLLIEKGIFEQRFFTSEVTRICMVDLEDLAEAISTILMKPGHTGATYELCGPENLSMDDMLSALKKNFDREVKAQTTPDEIWAAKLKKHGLGDYQINTLLTMFHHYNNHGFAGNPNALTWLLGRRPNDFAAFIQRTMQENGNFYIERSSKGYDVQNASDGVVERRFKEAAARVRGRRPGTRSQPGEGQGLVDGG
jgi:Predicted nucleoside-diphosphate-sugar epimerases